MSPRRHNNAPPSPAAAKQRRGPHSHQSFLARARSARTRTLRTVTIRCSGSWSFEQYTVRAYELRHRPGELTLGRAAPRRQRRRHCVFMRVRRRGITKEYKLSVRGWESERESESEHRRRPPAAAPASLTFPLPLRSATVSVASDGAYGPQHFLSSLMLVVCTGAPLITILDTLVTSPPP